MFTRRHPFLFFLIIMTTSLTFMFLGFVVLISFGSKMIDTQFAQKHAASDGNIGIVEINGIILSSKDIIQDIKTFSDEKNIKAIILRIDSPGGGIGPSQEIYREIMKTKKNKKIITSMGSVAASGGYYIASATDGIIANPGTLTGSIGVIMEYVNLMEIAKKIGISPIVIKSGEFKDMGSPLRELKESEKLIFQDLVNELHLQFVSDAAKARNIDVQTMATLADGRVYTGQKALKLKLIDRLGNLDDAVQWAGEIAHIQGELKPVYPKEDKMAFIKKFADTLLKDINISGTVTDNLRYIIN
ncbi:MAG: signal peptide peptidase SppA [Proteobacteria bacterium]|nr:signal peptide peptidase SppA [Pseudomonadota bacterium]MBU1585256.1 signal peptide peptidase SppA [Pseudomonadota bacterium]MBU2456246.1 signal peptide peptidase SppA [Pseudomonadota bacterium]MBU2630227.1 signal peptide peptidase SppA [Pseudomonadota bacterium]